MSILTYNFICPILVYALFLKTGIAPMHAWYPIVINTLTWPAALLLSTWQKLVPMGFLFFLLFFIETIIPLLPIPLRPVVGAIIGLNQTFLRPIFSYSSIRHIGWIIAASLYSPTTAIFYFFVYVITSIPAFTLIFTLKVDFSTNIYSLASSDVPLTITLSIILLSIAGIPPFASFIPKLITLLVITPTNPPLAILLIITSLITLYYYITIIFHILLNCTISHHKTPPTRPSLIAPNLLALVINLIPYFALLLCALALFHQP